MNDFVNIAYYDNAIDAHMAKSKLEAHGIESYLADEHSATMMSHLNNALGGIKLRVLESNSEEARKILEIKNELIKECPNCNSPDTIEQSYVKWGTIVAAIIIGLFPNKNRQFQCKNCEHVWKDF